MDTQLKVSIAIWAMDVMALVFMMILLVLVVAIAIAINVIKESLHDKGEVKEDDLY